VKILQLCPTPITVVQASLLRSSSAAWSPRRRVQRCPASPELGLGRQCARNCAIRMSSKRRLRRSSKRRANAARRGSYGSLANGGFFLFFLAENTYTIMEKGDKLSANGDYGLGKFLFDTIMTIVTAGFWLIWIFVRELRRA
jgi:hypothetical protein